MGGAGLGINFELNLPKLLPAPVGVQVGGADEGQLEAQHIGDGCPGGAF